MNSSYQKWTPPKFTVDIQFLKRIFEEPQASQNSSHEISKDNQTVHARLIIMIIFRVNYSQLYTHIPKHINIHIGIIIIIFRLI